MSENTITQEDRATPKAPEFNPDSQLMADLEGSEWAVRAYQREGDALRGDVASE